MPPTPYTLHVQYRAPCTSRTVHPARSAPRTLRHSQDNKLCQIRQIRQIRCSMHLYLNRYLGTPNITKSTLTLCSDEGEILLRCEAREPTYRDYAEPFRRHSFHCLPRGTHRCIVSSAPGNRICLRVVRVKGHRGTRLCVDPQRQFHLGTVLLGQADPDVKPPWRRLTGQRQLQEQYMALLLDHIDEDYFLHVDNTHCEETSE